MRRSTLCLTAVLVCVSTSLSTTTAWAEDCGEGSSRTPCLVLRGAAAFGSYAHTNAVLSERTAAAGLAITRDSTNVGQFGLTVQKAVFADIADIWTGKTYDKGGAVRELLLEAVKLTADLTYGDTIRLRRDVLRDDVKSAETHSIGVRYEVDLGTLAKHLFKPR